MTSQILKSVDSTKTQKSRYLQKKTLFLFQIKKFINWVLIAIYGKNSFVAEITFKIWVVNKYCLLIYFLINNIFPSHDWSVCLRFSLILICATLFKWANCHSNSILKDLRKLMYLPRAVENMCVLFGA